MKLNRKHKNMMKAGFATSMLLSYIFAFLFIDAIHSIKHSSLENEHCTVQLEANKCHKAVFHHDTENGCEHAEHVDNSLEKCDLCVASLIKKTKLGLDFNFSKNYSSQKPNSHVTALHDLKAYSLVFTLKTRGPPTT